jgi:RNA polymerase sigma-70 factor (ECF subfamily)
MTPLGAEPPASLDAALCAYVAAARQRWPDLELDEAEFVRYVAARLVTGQLPPVTHAADVWLACACERGLPRALVAFDSEHAPVIRRVLGRRKAPDDVADDVHQILRERLLVSDASTGKRAKIADYNGSGPLKSWVATAAATTLATLQRGARRRREDPESTGGADWAAKLDPELEYLKGRYARDVEQAIIAALDALGDRDRTLLSLHLGERLSIDVLGAMYGVNRATAARWLAAARRALSEHARARLVETLKLGPSELDSLIALVNSQLEVSIVRRLGSPGSAGQE